jgi:hypothetical protein
MFQSGAIAEALNSKPHTSSVGIYISILSHRSHCCCAAALVQDRNKIIMLYRDISFSFFYNFKYKIRARARAEILFSNFVILFFYDCNLYRERRLSAISSRSGAKHI